MKLNEIQGELREQGLDGWLFFDHHHRDPLAYRVLGLQASHVSRRWYYLIPAAGEPKKLVHRIESKVLESLPGTMEVYSSWAEQTGAIRDLLSGMKRVAMQYSPNCAIPYVSTVDAGTMDLIRSSGVEVVTSAALIQIFEAQLDRQALQSHLRAGGLVDQTRAETFRYIAESLRNGVPITEWDAAEFVRRMFRERALVTENGPIVAVDGHAGDPHYEPQPGSSAPIKEGSFVLLDLWAKLTDPGAIYYDITWTGYCGETVPENINQVFRIVRDARIAASEAVRSAFLDKKPIAGFEVDDAARRVIQDAGFGNRFVHRTGHSIGVEVHANGANMDNLETHDDRMIIPWSCFSIEPGIYLDDFGVRSEVNMFVDNQSARVTGAQQEEVVLIR